MSLPAGFFYKDGAYWGIDGTGPYVWNGVSMVLFGNGGSGGGGSFSFPSDPTAVGVGAASVVVNGVTHALTYNGDGSLATDTVDLIGTSDIVRTVSYGDGGVPYFSGNIFSSGAWTMTAAQARYLKEEILDSLGAAANGLRVRVTDLFYTTSIANATPIYREGVLEWQTSGYIPVSGCVFRVRHQSQHALSSAESAALSTIVLPRWLCKNGAKWKWNQVILGNSGTAGTFSMRPKVNGTSLATVTSASGATSGGGLEVDINCQSDTAQFYYGAPLMIAGGTASSSTVSLVTTAIDTASNDLTLTVTGQFNAVTDRTMTHYETTAELVA